MNICNRSQMKNENVLHTLANVCELRMLVERSDGVKNNRNLMLRTLFLYIDYNLVSLNIYFATFQPWKRTSNTQLYSRIMLS